MGQPKRAQTRIACLSTYLLVQLMLSIYDSGSIIPGVFIEIRFCNMSWRMSLIRNVFTGRRFALVTVTHILSRYTPGY